MYSSRRHWIFASLVGGALAWTTTGRAWVETSIQSDAVDVEVDRAGKASVRHELLVRVRGGPLRGLELAGADSDAEPFADGTIVESIPGRAATPLPLLIERRDDGTLVLEIDNDGGIRRGSYLVRFGYRTDLMARRLVTLSGGQAEVRWIGPRYPQGIDSAKVVFRLPPAPEAPALPPLGGSADSPDLGADPAGIFLATLRRGAEKDELEIVRPHVAQGEPVVWRVLADARAFGAGSPDAATVPPTAIPRGDGPASTWRLALLGAAGAIALAYALAVVLKWRAFVRACALRGATPRSLIPLPAALRGAVAASLLVGAGASAVFAEQPTLGGVLLVLSMLFASAAPARPLPPLRGPGEWQPVPREVAFARRPGGPPLPGRWLDAGSVRGFALFALVVSALAAGVVALLPISPYHALLLALGSASLVPIFCTGRPSELPRDPVVTAAGPLGRLHRRLAGSRELVIEILGRVPVGGTSPDELRLAARPRSPLPGLVVLEVALEVQLGAGGAMALPVLLVRALEGSAAHERLSGVVRWGRGRSVEERVAILRPKLPTVAMTASLVLRVAEMLTDGRRKASATRAPSARRGGASTREASGPRFSRKATRAPSSAASPD